MTMRSTTIYALIDLADGGRVRYVGRTVASLTDRLRNHLYGALPCKSWVRANPASVQIVPLEVVPFEAWAASRAERKWIEHYRSIGYNLFNIAPKIKSEKAPELNQGEKA